MIKKLIISLLILVLPGFAVAAEITLTDVITALETPFKGETAEAERISDFKAEFAQESHVASINRTQQGSGSVYFRFIPASADEDAVAQFRWDYRKPDIQEIISDGSKMWVYLPGNKQVIESDISGLREQQGENPVTFLSGLGNISKDFQVKWGTEKNDRDGNFLLHLVPRHESQLIQQMEVIVSHEAVSEWLKLHKTGNKFPILATFVTDQQDNRTLIKFDQIKVNNRLKTDQFIFTKPDDVELVRPEQMSF
jgi:outer membrane lipoprotein carrier protein